MKEEKRIFPFMYISSSKFMIMIAKSCNESRFHLFWDALYMVCTKQISMYYVLYVWTNKFISIQ